MMMMYVLSVLLYVTSALLVAAVLLQPHKSEGAVVMESTIFGVPTEGGPLITVTFLLAGIIFAIVMGMHYFA